VTLLLLAALALLAAVVDVRRTPLATRVVSLASYLGDR
jgi:hypothetical protein